MKSPDMMQACHFAGAAKKRIVIAGSGIGGTTAAKTLEHLLGGKGDRFEVTLLGRTPEYVFKPLLPDMITGTRASMPMRDIFTPSSPVHFKEGEIRSISVTPSAQSVTTDAGEFPYDTLVLALGNINRITRMPGAEQYAIPVEEPKHIRQIQDSIRTKLDAVATLDPRSPQFKANLSFVIMGAGLSGLETAFGIKAFAKQYIKKHHPHRSYLVPTITLVHASPDILSDALPRQQKYVKKRLAEENITVLYSHKVVGVSADGIDVIDANNQPKHLTAIDPICTVGGDANPLLANLPIKRDPRTSRIEVDEHLRLTDHPAVYAIGDIAAIRNKHTGKLLPMLGQVAEQEGQYVARDISATADGKPSKPFKFNDRGRFLSTGPDHAQLWVNPLPFSFKSRLSASLRSWFYQRKLEKLRAQS